MTSLVRPYGFVVDKRAQLLTTLVGVSLPAAMAATRPVMVVRVSRRALAALQARPDIMVLPRPESPASFETPADMQDHANPKVRQAFAAMQLAMLKFLETARGQVDPALLERVLPDTVETEVLVVGPTAAFVEAAQSEPSLVALATALEGAVTAAVRAVA